MNKFNYLVILVLFYFSPVLSTIVQDSASFVSCPPFRQFTDVGGLSYTVAVENAANDSSYSVRLWLYNQSWYNQFTFACDQLADRSKCQCVVALPRKNFTTDASAVVVKQQWLTKLWLVEEDTTHNTSSDVTECQGLLLDAITEPVLRWRLGMTVVKPAVKLNAMKRLPVISPCARDVQIWFLQNTGDAPAAPIIAAVTSNGFERNDQDTLTWFDMGVTCPDCHLLAVVLTNYFLLILSDNAIFVSNNLGDASPAAAAAATKQLVQLTPRFHLQDFDCNPVKSGQLTYTPSCQSRYHDPFIEDLVFANLQCENGKGLLVISSAESNFSVWRELKLDKPIQSVAYNPHMSILMVLFEPSRTENTTVSLEGRKIFVNNLTVDNLPMVQSYKFVDDVVTMVIFDHFTMNLLAFGDWVWLSTDGGNSFEHIYKFGVNVMSYDTASEVIPGWHYDSGLVAVLSKTKLIISKTGVMRMQHQNLKDILGPQYTYAYFAFDANGTLHFFLLSLNISGVIEIRAVPVDIDSLIQESSVAFDHSLLVHRVSDNIVMVYEYKNKESFQQSNAFHNGHIGLRIRNVGQNEQIELKIVDVMTFVSTTSSLTSRFATVLTTVTGEYDWVSTTTGVLKFVSWSSTERYVLFSATNNAISGVADIYKTIAIPYVLSCIIESFDSGTNQAKCYTPLKVGLDQGTEIAAGYWYLLDFSSSFSTPYRHHLAVGEPHWKLYEPPCFQFLSSSMHIRQFDVDLSFSVDIDVSLTVKKLVNEEVGFQQLRAFVTNPRLFRLRFNHSHQQIPRIETVVVHLESNIMMRGITLVRFVDATMSMTCPRTGILFTVVAGCPAARRLNFLYPVNLTASEWLAGDKTDADGRRLLEKIESNYRPPSDLGFSIPMSSNIYCVDHSKPLPKYLYRVSQRSGALSQCTGVEGRSDCNCTEQMKISDDDMFSYCKCYVYRVKFPGNLTLNFNLQLDDTLGQFIACSDKHCLFSVTELNNRTNWKIEMTCSSILLSSINLDHNSPVSSKQYYIPGCSMVKMEGAGLYNFRAEVMPELSFCPLYSEFMVFVTDVPITNITKFTTNFIVALFFGGLLFVATLCHFKSTGKATARRRKLTRERDLDTELIHSVGQYPPSGIPPFALEPTYNLKSVPEDVYLQTRAAAKH